MSFEEGEENETVGTPGVASRGEGAFYRFFTANRPVIAANLAPKVLW